LALRFPLPTTTAPVNATSLIVASSDDVGEAMSLIVASSDFLLVAGSPLTPASRYLPAHPEQLYWFGVNVTA